MLSWPVPQILEPRRSLEHLTGRCGASVLLMGDVHFVNRNAVKLRMKGPNDSLMAETANAVPPEIQSRRDPHCRYHVVAIQLRDASDPAHCKRLLNGHYRQVFPHQRHCCANGVATIRLQSPQRLTLNSALARCNRFNTATANGPRPVSSHD